MKTYCSENDLLVRVDSIGRAVGDVFYSDSGGGAVRGSRVGKENASALGGRKDVEVGSISKGGYEGASRVAASLVGGVDGVDGKRDAGRVATTQVVNLKAESVITTYKSLQIRAKDAPCQHQC